MSNKITPLRFGRPGVGQGDFRPQHKAPKLATAAKPALPVGESEDPKDLSALERADSLQEESQKVQLVKKVNPARAVKVNTQPREPKSGTQTS